MSVAIGQLKRAYDEVPYTSHPFPLSAPENLAAVAHLFGLATPPVATARVLELGCSSGGNLVPFAARTPDAQILGIDLSGVQIGMGRKRIEALGLSNIELMEGDLSALDSNELGVFDYIVCHGVYSWVPPHVQSAILRICKENLAANGVAYVSYNVYPGWKAREIVRDAMMLRGGARATPAEGLAYAKGMLDFLEQVAPKDSVLSKTLELTLPDLRRQRDYYLSHEYLEPFNSPCYFQEFVERAVDQGLAYLAEAQPAVMFASNYGEHVAGPLLKECGHSQVLLEQYLDFIVNRTFRQTLLVHGDRGGGIRYRLEPERLHEMHFASYLPCSDGESRLDTSRQTYGTGGAAITTERPEVKAALDVLTAAWPDTVSYEGLLEDITERTASVDRRELSSRLDELLEVLVIKDLSRIRLSPVSMGPGTDPVSVDETIRRVAELSREEGAAMTFNAWHEPVPLGIIEAWLLPELDGTRDHEALLVSLEKLVREGKVAFERQGSRVAEPSKIEECITEHIEAMPARLATQKLVKLDAQ